ncbi:hypothetical protein E4U60_000258 [Claviceps pazoutovae]|uniref:Uncharacterized protein n=1 Tax=Claviceps pazoutovae TaxID=1649127 RepID=A0A9P7M0J6_9HYPO|nr:hypothetical protein E4U60_000258 [Claviceps pazoutovae]
MSPLDALDAQSQAQIHAVIQQAVRDGLAATEQRLAQSEAVREQQAAQLADLNTAFSQLYGAQSPLQATAATNPAVTHQRPPPMRPLFDGTASQFRSWKITIEDRLATDCAGLTPRQWIFVNDSLADPIQKRLAHYFESGERRDWSGTDFIAYLDTLFATTGLPDSGGICVQCVEVRDEVRARPVASLARLEIVSQPLLDGVGKAVVDKDPLLSWSEAGTVRSEPVLDCDLPTPELGGRPAYKAAAARDRALDFRSALRRMPVSSTTAGPSRDPEGDTVMTGVASAGFAGKGKGKAEVGGGGGGGGQGEGSGTVDVQGCVGRAAVIGPVLALRCR